LFTRLYLRVRKTGNKSLKQVTAAKAMKQSAEGVNAYDEIIAVGPGRRTIKTVWRPTRGAFFLERKRCKELSRAQRAQDYRES